MKAIETKERLYLELVETKDFKEALNTEDFVILDEEKRLRFLASPHKIMDTEGNLKGIRFYDAMTMIIWTISLMEQAPKKYKLGIKKVTVGILDQVINDYGDNVKSTYKAFKKFAK